MKTSKCIALSILALLFTGTCASAHHNTGAVFDMDAEVTFDGVIEEYEWKNPHLYFYVSTTDESGESAVWRIEAGPLAIMRRLGWTRDSLAKGEKISFVGKPSRNPNRKSAFLVSVKSETKELPSFMSEEAFEILFATGESSGSAPKTDRLSGTWVAVLSIEGGAWIDYPDRLVLTEAGTAATQEFDEATMHPGLSCTPMTAPAVMVIPDTKSIEVRENEISLRAEFDNVDRIVSMIDTGKEEEPSIQGQSIGRWQGRALVVETTNFAAHRNGNAFGLPSGPQKKLVESFELNPDRTSLTYRFELTDPEFIAETVIREIQWIYRPDVDYAAEKCDLENSRLFLKD